MMTREQQEVLAEYLAADKTQREVIKQAYAVALADIKRQTQALMNKVQTSSVLYQLQYKKAMAEQIEGILTLLESQLVTDTTDYLARVYDDGFYGSAYAMAAQGVPIAFGVDQKQLAAAINVKIDDYKFSDRIRANVDDLKKVTKMEITRGIANGSTYAEIARNIAQHTDESLRRAQIITRTEAHRVQQTAREDAMQEAKKRGADIVKMWDSTLDGKTRRTHRKLDGQIRELDEPFEVDGKKAMRPGGFGRPEEDINCRCHVLERARWALKGKRRKLDNENQFDENGNLNYISTDDKRYQEWKAELEKAVKKQKDKLGTANAIQTAKTVGDVEALLKNSGWYYVREINGKTYSSADGISLSGCDFDIAKGIYATQEKLFTKYPQLAGKLNAISSAKLGKFTYAQCSFGLGHGGVVVNTSLFSDIEKLAKSYEKDVLAKFHPAGTTWESIVTHEFGHAIDDYLTYTLKLAGVSGRRPKIVSAYLRPRVMKACGLKVSDVGEAVSGYATQNAQEWFAECFAEWMESPNPRPVAAEFGKQLEELLKDVE